MSVKSTFLQIDQVGDPEKVLKKVEAQLDGPKENEVLVRMLAAPINPANIIIIQGDIHIYFERKNRFFKLFLHLFDQVNTVKVHSSRLFRVLKEWPRCWNVVKM